MSHIVVSQSYKCAVNRVIETPSVSYAQPSNMWQFLRILYKEMTDVHESARLELLATVTGMRRRVVWYIFTDVLEDVDVE